MITTIPQLIAQPAAPRAIVVAGANSTTALTATAAAVHSGIAQAHLVGPIAEIRKSMRDPHLSALHNATLHDAQGDESIAHTAVALVAAGVGAVILKGSLRTDQLLRAVLDRQYGLRQGLLSDVLLYEDRLSGACRLVGITDGGINVQPSVDDLRVIVRNGVAVLHALGVTRPRVALLSATEAVTTAVPSTINAHQIALSSPAADCEIAGPLALDNALLESAARAKGIDSPVAGHADLMVVPNIEAGNVLGKAVKYYYGSITAHVVVGARVPVLIPSRVESAEDKLASIALGILIAGTQR